MIDIFLKTNLNVVKTNLYFLIIEVIDVHFTMPVACTCYSIEFFKLKSGKQKHNMQKHKLLAVYLDDKFLDLTWWVPLDIIFCPTPINSCNFDQKPWQNQFWFCIYCPVQHWRNVTSNLQILLSYDWIPLLNVVI